MTRQEANILIAKEILRYCEDPNNSDTCFGEILVNMHVLEFAYNERTGIYEHPIDPSNEESVKTLKRML